MQRLLLTFACALAVGCASSGSAPVPVAAAPAPAVAPVDAGPPVHNVVECNALTARIARSQGMLAGEGGTWLNAPDRMVEDRRIRALSARAEDLGCFAPQG